MFRIDHYLGKETVQSLLVMRFANSIFEPLWNHKYVDHVQITVAEEEGVGTRANYYEEAGALRDMVQNHILQLLCLTAMEPPWSLSADVVRDHQLAVLHCLRPIVGRDVDASVVRAQYAAGFPSRRRGAGLSQRAGREAGFDDGDLRRAEVLHRQLALGGSALLHPHGQAAAEARERDRGAVQGRAAHPVQRRRRRRRSSPTCSRCASSRTRASRSSIATKLPGPKVRIYPVKMDFRYGTTFGDQTPEAYERLLLDVMAGDATLFMRRDAVEASWTWITNLLTTWQERGTRWLPQYPAGTWAPLEADKLIEADGRRWRTL